MKIGIDARIFVSGEYAGIARSVLEILQVWAEEYPEHEYYLLSHMNITLPYSLPENWHVIVRPWKINRNSLWNIFLLPKLIRELQLDVFWGTNYTLPASVKGVRYYVTIYDMALFRYPEVGRRGNVRRLYLHTKPSCRRAERVIAISQSTARDVVSLFHISPEKVCVSYCGGLDRAASKEMYQYTMREVRKELTDLQEPYFLFIGTIEPRKNLLRVIHAFEQFCREEDTARLVLAGKIGWRCDDILKAVNESPYADLILLTGYINESEKKYLLSHACAFVYPSIYEGFGIPILEGMAYDLPVITTNVSSMPEVGGDAVYYLQDAENETELYDLMKKVYNLPGEERKQLSERIARQQNKFSWGKNASEMMAILQEKTASNTVGGGL